MRRFGVLTLAIALPVLLIAAVVTGQNLASILADDDRGADRSAPLPATVVATGIPGAGAIAQAGTFHTGGPFAPGGALAAASIPFSIEHDCWSRARRISAHRWPDRSTRRAPFFRSMCRTAS